MVSPNPSMRVGSGGITYDITGNASQLKQTLADAAKWAKDQKIQPQIDFEQTTVVRGVEKIRRAIQREVFKAQIAVELDRLGLAEVAKQIGALKGSAAIAIEGTYGDTGTVHGPGVRSRFSRFEADVRSEQAGLLRGIRRDTRRADVERAARFGVFGDEDAGESSLDQLAAAGAGRRGRAPSRAGRTGFLADVNGGFNIVSQVVQALGQGALAGAQFRTATGIAGSSDRIAGLHGQLGQMDALGSVPVLGTVVRVMDEISGMSRSLKAQIQGEEGMRAHAVNMASIMGNPLNLQQAQSTATLQALKSSYGAQGFDVDNPNQFGFLDAGFAGSDAAVRHYRATQQEEQLKMKRAQLGTWTRSDLIEADTSSLKSEFNYQPHAGARNRLLNQLVAEGKMATFDNPQDQGRIQDRNAQALANFDRQWDRSIGFANFDATTSAAASQIRVRNRGQSFADESTLLALRGFDRDIAMATEEGGFKTRARMTGAAGARGILASLMVRGGGVVGATNLGTDLVGDPLGLVPELQARSRAKGMTQKFLANLDGAGSRTLDLAADGVGRARHVPAGPGVKEHYESDTSLLAQILNALNSIDDSLGRGLHD